MTITEFLEARITEDEAQAHNVLVFRMNPRTNMPGNQAIPARVRAECAAKRAIIKSYASSAAARPNAAFGQRFVLAGMETGLEIAMKSLAAVYASHPDYDPRWVA